MVLLVLLGGGGSTKLEMAQEGFSGAPYHSPEVKTLRTLRLSFALCCLVTVIIP